jgi:hypothetical protein
MGLLWYVMLSIVLYSLTLGSGALLYNVELLNGSDNCTCRHIAMLLQLKREIAVREDCERIEVDIVELLIIMASKNSVWSYRAAIELRRMCSYAQKQTIGSREDPLRGSDRFAVWGRRIERIRIVRWRDI